METNPPASVGTIAALKHVEPAKATNDLGLRVGFYRAMAILLLASVFIGFSRTFYLRAAFNVPHVPHYVLLHGAILTAWFAGFLAQVLLVRTGRTNLHRQFGRWVGGIALLVATVTAPIIVNLPARQTAQGLAIDGRIVRLVWLDLAILAAFVVFASTGILMRRHSAWHKRMMLLASVSIVTPAIGRAWRLVPALNERNALLTTGALVLCLLGLAAHDLVSRRRIHLATLAGAAFLMALRTLAGMIADSELGRSLIRGLG